MSAERAAATESTEAAPAFQYGAARDRLFELLAEVRGRLRRAALLEASVATAAGGAFAIVLGAVASLASGKTAAVATLELCTLAGTVVFVAGRYGRLLAGSLASASAVAAWLDRAISRHLPHARDRIDLVSAVELDRDRGRYGESAELGDSAVWQATAAALTIDSRALVRKEAWSSLRARITTLVVVALVIAGLGAAAPKHLAHALSAMSAMSRLDNPLVPSHPEPRLGDFRITYRFPAYSERAPRVVNSPTGDLRALPGTEITIETNARDDLARGTLFVSYGDPSSTSERREAESARADASPAPGTPARDEPPAEQLRTGVEVDGRHLKATIIASRAGRYRFHLESETGEIFEERRGHAIELELDDPPEITQLEPTESPLEVNEHDRLPLVFAASDDFGLGEIYFSWRVIGSTREGKERLSTAARGQRQHSGTAQLDLAQLRLQPGDRVAYTLEVRDNDTVNGPKLGAAVTKELRVYSKASHHAQVLALEEQSLDELVHILGDNLESPFEALVDVEPYRRLVAAAEGIVERATKADELLRRAVAAARKDPLGRPAIADAFEAARVQLGRDNRRKRSAVITARRALGAKQASDKDSARGVRAAQDVMVGSLEKNVVYLADLLNDQRMIDAEALAKELRAQQQALRKALEEYKAAPDAAKREQLTRAIAEIKQRISDIMKELAKTRGSIPTDYLNSDALEQRDSQESMDEIAKKIEEGDLDGAMAELDRMLGETEKMMAELQSGREELGGREYSEIQERAQKIWDDLQNAEKQERELAQKTEKLSKEVLDRMKQRLGDPASFVEKQKKRLEQVAEALERAKPGAHFSDGDPHDQATRRVDDGSKALEARDFGAAREMVESALDLVEQLQQETRRRAEQAQRFGDLFGSGRSAERAERELHKALPILEEVLEDIEKLMPPPESLLSPEERQQLAQNRARQDSLKDKVEKLGQELEKLGQDVPIVGPEMPGMISEAAGAMGQARDSLGQGDAPSALNQQRRAIDALQRLKQELEKRSSGRQSGGGGVPLPFGQPSGEPQQSDGSSEQFSPQKVEIPKPEQFKAPAEFREDILEAAKQGTVEDYREAVRRYYEELVK